MRKIAVIIAFILIVPMVACAAEKAKEPQKETQQPKPKEATLQELQAQRAVLALRIEGAEASKKAVERIILDGQVALSKLDEQIQAQAAKAVEKK